MSTFGAIGGSEGSRQLCEAFYSRVARDPVLRPLFPGKSMRCAIEELSAFLVQFFDGPVEDTQKRWWLSLKESHRRFEITPQHREAWIARMKEALEEVRVDAPARDALLRFFEHSSAYIADVPAPATQLDEELHQRWETQRALDDTVEKIRAGQTDAVCLRGAPAIDAHLLSLMIASDPAFVEKSLRENPILAKERFAARTLLHSASGQGSARIVAVLLELDADPNVKDDGGHTPLYWAANGERAGDGVVHTLVSRGAAVDACDGVKRCTPLHMAARRGNIEVARALIEYGANIEARDSVGDTPLRRAVNCGKVEVAGLLLSEGANRHSIGSKGLTPITAVRTAPMRRVFAP